MLVAMMAPLIIEPVRHVRDRSLASHRTRRTALFLAGYAVAWALAALVLFAAAGATQQIGGTALAVACAVVWQASPAKQRALNRCHFEPALPAFGSAADIAAVRFGLSHGFWCVGACAPLMLIPIAARAHALTMLGVTAWLAAERVESPRQPGWRLRLPGKAIRILLVQSRESIAGWTAGAGNRLPTPIS